jgi:MHS family proline/betaine transporter-like MFS transporter
MSYFTSKEKEIIGILSLGTFLEYFDFYLYFHFATALNKVFFAPADIRSTALLTSFAFCTSYIFRPFAAIFFGYIGDKFGRRIVINITFVLMGISCLGIFFLPSYDSIGILASILITLLRALQGMSTMGEIVGGEIYLTEYLNGRKVFIGVSLLLLMCSLSCIVALWGIRFSLEGFFDWRYLFLGGLLIFICGYFARRSLNEAPEFLKTKITRSHYNDEKISLKTYISLFFIEALQPAMLFISVVGINNIFKHQFGYSDADIVERNLNATYFHMLYVILATTLFIYFNPLKIAISRILGGILLLLVSPIILTYFNSKEMLIAIQSLWCFFFISDVSILPLKHKNIPIRRRFMVGTIGFAFSRGLVAVLTSFVLIAVEGYLGNYMLLVFGLPFAIGFYFALIHFRELDKKNPNGLLQYYE